MAAAAERTRLGTQQPALALVPSGTAAATVASVMAPDRFKGTSPAKNGKWIARFARGERRGEVHLGTHDTREQAAHAYDW